jgi:hypothetical protein
MKKLQYAYAYALSDMRHITLVLMQSSYSHHLRTSLHSHTGYQTVLRLTIQVHLQHSNLVQLTRSYLSNVAIGVINYTAGFDLLSIA